MATALGHGAGILPTRAGGVVSLRRSANGACRLRREFGGDGVRGLKVVGVIRGSGRDVIQRDSVDQERESLSGALSDLVRQSATSSSSRSPEVSLREGRWVKLICGASFERVFACVVDCIDCAADSAVVAAVLEGVTAAQLLARHLNVTVGRPWIMVSINDDDDPHFRKAEFDPALCPTDCPRPCERVCPATAIAFKSSTDEERLQSSSLASTGHSNQHSNFQSDGVITERCYGCGRCLPICPLGLIHARTYVRDLRAVANLLSSNDIDAIEIHTGAGHLEAFHRVVGDLSDVLLSLKLIAVSVPDLGDRMIPALATMYESLRPVLKGLNLWQLDGRPMSGDIGAGATKAAVALAESVAASEGRPPGYLQLAGGTNSHTVDALERQGLFLTSDGNKAIVAGVAYGGYARKIVTKYLKKMESCHETWDFTDSAGSSLLGIEHYPSLLLGALQEATALVAPFKGHVRRQ
ncbi:hypothetical protein KC19_2G255900 [Ceratodon purpureus]|uniref:4Fe-4S ferredoxin-type domain-containing protein n=1 Tax=Ceratodon purpureus TaxID=3225 RepID=A0A8T0J1P1_CERPU|nr:hypothetical protein KC19_2G255900 [Ceratodon purpureus]